MLYFSEEEKNIIMTAMSNHSHKERIDNVYSELIKMQIFGVATVEKTVKIRKAETS